MQTVDIGPGLRQNDHRQGSLTITTLHTVVLGGIALVALTISLFVATELVVQTMAVIGIGVPLVLLVRAYPELGMICLVFLTSNFIRTDFVDIRVAGGGLDMRDLLLIGLVGAPLVTRLFQGRLTIPWWPVSTTMVIFLAAVTFSAMYGLLLKRVNISYVMAEFRPAMYYTAFFATAWLITRPGQVIRILIGLFLLADLTSTIIILQQVAGRGTMILGSMSNTAAWYIREGGTGEFGTVRIVPPGHVLTYVASVVAFGFMLWPRLPGWARAMASFQFLYLNVGLMFTYTRAQWVASAVAILGLTVVLPMADKGRILKYVLIASVLGSIVFSIFGSQIQQATADATFVTAVTDRALSLFRPEETLETNSLEWRVLETQEAYLSVTRRPVLGVGLGNSYREPFLLQGEAAGSGSGLRKIRFVHNSYLFIAVKTGLIGLAAFVVFALTLLVSGWVKQRRMVNEYCRRLVLTILISFVGFFLWSGSQTHLMQVESTVIVGLLVGLVVTMEHIDHALKGDGRR